MNTPTRTHQSLALSLGMTPEATLSTTARATAAWAGPNICTACFAPLIVTLLNRMVSGLAGRLGVTTASRVVKPSLLLLSAFRKAAPAWPLLLPMTRSMCAISLPSPTSDSPRKKSAAMLASICGGLKNDLNWRQIDIGASTERGESHRLQPSSGPARGWPLGRLVCPPNVGLSRWRPDCQRDFTNIY